jgi:CRISPR/Cas system-associated exonuclease Cas4 (RecB family)
MGAIIKNFGEAIESTLGIPIEFSMMISIAIVGYVVYLLIK